MNIPTKKTNRASASHTDTKRKVKNDILLICSLLLFISAVALALFILKTDGDTVTVTVDGKAFGEYQLSENVSVEITSADGYNLLVIENGKAYVSHASCPDGICSSHRPIQYDGESIICLPNKVVIEVHSQSKDRPDIIT